MEKRPSKPSKAELNKWDAILASEGMPTELESSLPPQEHTPAFDSVVSELYLHYATTATDNYGAHRQALDSLRSRLTAAGGSDDEMQLLDEDFARTIEDAVTDLQKTAVRYAEEVKRARPMLIGRPEAITRMVLSKLKDDTHGAISEEALRSLSERAAETLH